MPGTPINTRVPDKNVKGRAFLTILIFHWITLTIPLEFPSNSIGIRKQFHWNKEAIPMVLSEYSTGLLQASKSFPRKAEVLQKHVVIASNKTEE